MFRDTTYTELTRANDDAHSGELVMDEDAFRALYDRHARRLWAYLVRLTGDRQFAEDLLQETFYRFLRTCGEYENESHRRNSLFAIATNVARDARRRSLVRLPLISRRDPESCTGADPAGAAGRSADLARALAALKPRERALLWLAYAEGATHDEIASAVGVRPSSLKSMLFRARRRLATLLGGTYEGVR